MFSICLRFSKLAVIQFKLMKHLNCCLPHTVKCHPTTTTCSGSCLGHYGQQGRILQRACGEKVQIKIANLPREPTAGNSLRTWVQRRMAGVRSAHDWGRDWGEPAQPHLSHSFYIRSNFPRSHHLRIACFSFSDKYCTKKCLLD